MEDPFEMKIVGQTRKSFGFTNLAIQVFGTIDNSVRIVCSENEMKKN